MIRWRNGRPSVELYDERTGVKKHIRPRDFGMPPFTGGPRKMERQAKELERLALNARDRSQGWDVNEPVESFADRWPSSYGSRGKSTQLHYEERVSTFKAEYGTWKMRDVTRDMARQWALKYPGTLKPLRAMFADALNDHLIDANPFAKLGLAQSQGRKDITVLTREEIDLLAATAREVFGPKFGIEFAAMVVWAAYTMMRPGEIYAARYGLLNGDVYSLQSAINARTGEEGSPKNRGVGSIFVPEPAREAVLSKPRLLSDDLMFHTQRGYPFRQYSLSWTWAKVRDAFVKQLPAGHHLNARLAVDPTDRMAAYELRHAGASYMLNELGLEPWVIARQLRHKDGGRLVVQLYGHPTSEAAIGQMRRAFGGSVRELRPVSGEILGKRNTGTGL